MLQFHAQFVPGIRPLAYQFQHSSHIYRTLPSGLMHSKLQILDFCSGIKLVLNFSEFQNRKLTPNLGPAFSIMELVFYLTGYPQNCQSLFRENSSHCKLSNVSRSLLSAFMYELSATLFETWKKILKKTLDNRLSYKR